MGAIRWSSVGALILLASTTLVACTETHAEPPEPTSMVETPSPASDPEPEPEADPELVPGGTAEDNVPYFNFVNAAFLADGNPGARPIIDNLVAAGFDKAAMQVTADRTPRGSAVDSVQFSMQTGDECIIGQADGVGYVSTVAPALESGGCLVGNTRAIDW